MISKLNPVSRRRLFSFAAGVALVAGSGLGAAPAQAQQTLRWAFQGNLNTLDPYGINETTTLGLQGNVYEGLTKRDKDLKIIPGLAERWEILDNGMRWRFYLRKGVKFHNGNDFNADDVVFSAQRVVANNSQLTSRLSGSPEFSKVDDFTVDVKLKSPNPILHYAWDTWYIMDKEWTEANNAQIPPAPQATTPGFATINANGTGPFRITEHQLGVRTVFDKNPNWWGKVEHNLDRVVFTPITSAPTRVAALLSGEVDVIDPVPLQDVPRINASANARVLEGPEVRTIYLSFDQMRPELTASSVKGKNPFKDVRVRKAFYQAIDIEAIRRQVMRGAAVPAASLISPLFFPQISEIKRHPFDLMAANKLLDDAGYKVGADGKRFKITHDFIPLGSDYQRTGEFIKQQLGRVGIDVEIRSQDLPSFFRRVYTDYDFDTTSLFYGAFADPTQGVQRLYWSKSIQKGVVYTNPGDYRSDVMDKVIEAAQSENDPVRRKALYLEMQRIAMTDLPVIPLMETRFITISSARLKNHTVTADGIIGGNFADAYFEK